MNILNGGQSTRGGPLAWGLGEVLTILQRKNYRVVVCFLLGNSSALEFYMPKFRNTLFHLHRPVKMERTECSEMLAYKI